MRRLDAARFVDWFRFAFRSAAKLGNLRRRELAELAGLNIENEGPIADAANLLDEMADGLKHFAQLAVAALDEDDFVPGIFRFWLGARAAGLCAAMFCAGVKLMNAGRRGLGFLRAGLAALDEDTGAKLVDLFQRGTAGDFDEIGFF